MLVSELICYSPQRGHDRRFVLFCFYVFNFVESVGVCTAQVSRHACIFAFSFIVIVLGSIIKKFMHRRETVTGVLFKLLLLGAIGLRQRDLDRRFFCSSFFLLERKVLCAAKSKDVMRYEAYRCHFNLAAVFFFHFSL